MASQNILASAVSPIIQQIKNNIRTYLDEIIADRPDGKVTLENPQEYFNYSPAIGYRCPAVFVVGDSIQFNQARGQNHINATLLIYVVIALEDRIHQFLETKAWRYHDALHKCLDRQQLDSGNARNIVKVIRSEFGQTMNKKGSSVDSVFRKQLMITLSVEQYQSEN